MTSLSLKKLADRGVLVDLPRGKKGVPASLQYRGKLNSRSRAERKNELKEALGKAIELVRSVGGEVDADSVSVSGQTIDSVIPADDYERVRKHLESEGMRLDLLVREQVL